jgi:hypothetical protein
MLMAAVYVGQYFSFLVSGRVTRSLLLRQDCAYSVKNNPVQTGRVLVSWQISTFS